MSQVKYKEYFVKMVEQNQDLFDEFAGIHARYVAEPIRYQAIFNSLGSRVTEVIRDWDRRLCSAMGRGKFSQYSQNLSEKFWGEVRKMFPAIDKVGVVVKN
jgi:hypothetical protein